MLSGVVLFLGGVLLFLTLLAAIPVRIRYQFAWRVVVDNRVDVSWLFGLVNVSLPTESVRRQDVPAGAPSSATQADSKRGSGALRAFREESFRRRLFRYLGDLWRSVDAENIRLRVRLGLDDPADTGLLWGVIGPVAALLGAAERISVRVEPDFAAETIDVDSSGQIRLIPLRPLVLTAMLGCSPAIWRGLRHMRAD